MPVIGRAFRNVKPKGAYDDPSLAVWDVNGTVVFDRGKYENNEPWLPARNNRAAEIKALEKLGSGASAKIETPMPREFDLALELLIEAVRHRMLLDGKGPDYKFSNWSFEVVLMHIDKNTSPGSWWAAKGYKTKGDVIADPEALVYLRAVYDETIRIDPAFTVSMKANELRAFSKTEENKTRYFAIAPIEHQVLALKWFGEFHDWFNEHMQHIFATGMNPFRGGWHDMMSDLTRNRKGIAMDGAAFDQSIAVEFYVRLIRLLETFHSWSEYKSKFLINTATAPLIDTLGNVIPTSGTNKSGWFLTLFLNSLATYLLFTAAWFYIVGDYPESKHDYEVHVKKRIQGDDSALGISDVVWPMYNQDTIIHYCSPWMKWEPSNSEPLPPEQLIFLSKKTVWDDVCQRWAFTWSNARVYYSLRIDRSGMLPFDRLAKYLSLRVLSFYDPEAFRDADRFCLDYINFLRPSFGGTKDFIDLTRGYLSDREIREFYCAPEVQCTPNDRVGRKVCYRASFQGECPLPKRSFSVSRAVRPFPSLPKTNVGSNTCSLLSIMQRHPNKHPKKKGPRQNQRGARTVDGARPPKSEKQFLTELLPKTLTIPSVRAALGSYRGMDIFKTSVDSAGRRTWIYPDLVDLYPAGLTTGYSTCVQVTPASFNKITAFQPIFGKVRLRAAAIQYMNAGGTGKAGICHGYWKYGVKQADPTTALTVAQLNLLQGQIARDANRDFQWNWRANDVDDLTWIPTKNLDGTTPTSFHENGTEDRFYFAQELTNSGGDCKLYLTVLLEFTEALV